MLVESREGLLELELASLPATTAFAARPLVVEVLYFLLERSEGAHFLNHLVCVGLQLALLLLDIVDVLADLLQLLLDAIQGLPSLIHHRDDLECVQAQQATVHIEPDDAFQALIANELNASSIRILPSASLLFANGLEHLQATPFGT